MKIYTRTGDDGTTGLFGGDRVSKDHVRINAYGTVDELNSVLGTIDSALTGPAIDAEPTVRAGEIIRVLQRDLFVAGADLATPQNAKAAVPRITSDHIERLETFIDELEADLEPLKAFILPGGTQAASMAHFARTVCRRAERNCVNMVNEEGEGLAVMMFLNRLSDLLFVMARWINRKSGISDIPWKPEI